MLKPQHIMILKQFLEAPELLDVHSYTGYNGGVVLRLRSSHLDFVNAVYEFCQNNGIECSSKYNHNLGTTEVFCIAQDDVYELRRKL